jgi:hypothetical protein
MSDARIDGAIHAAKHAAALGCTDAEIESAAYKGVDDVDSAAWYTSMDGRDDPHRWAAELLKSEMLERLLLPGELDGTTKLPQPHYWDEFNHGEGCGMQWRHVYSLLNLTDAAYAKAHSASRSSIIYCILYHLLQAEDLLRGHFSVDKVRVEAGVERSTRKDGTLQSTPHTKAVHARLERQSTSHAKALTAARKRRDLNRSRGNSRETAREEAEMARLVHVSCVRVCAGDLRPDDVRKRKQRPGEAPWLGPFNDADDLDNVWCRCYLHDHGAGCGFVNMSQGKPLEGIEGVQDASEMYSNVGEATPLLR